MIIEFNFAHRDERNPLYHLPAPHDCDCRFSRELQELARIEADPQYQKAGWDSYNGDPISPAAIAAAREFLGYAWAVVPCSDGGIQLERHHSGVDIEVSFQSDGSADVFAKTVETCSCKIDQHDFKCPVHNDAAPESRQHHE